MRGENNNSGLGFKQSLVCLLSLIIVVSAAYFGPRVTEFLSPYALVAAGVILPEGGKGQLEKMAINNLAKVNEIQGPAFLSNTGGKKPVADTPEAAEPTTETEQPTANLPAKPVSANIDFLKITPEDILTRMSAAIKTEDTEKHDGKAVNKEFTAKDANTVYKKVYVKNSTTKQLNIKSELEKGIDLEIKNRQDPCILIYHTHTTESYVLNDTGTFNSAETARSRDAAVNMIRIGEEIAKGLKEAGFNVIHDKTIHDDAYTGAYARSRQTVQKYLKQYPTIQVTLDIHRDAIHYSKTSRAKPTTVIGGKKAAQIMIITGVEEGNIKNFPNWNSNLRFALKLQERAQDMFEGLMKPIMFSPRKYNMDMTKYSLLLEMGTDVNTLEEAAYSGRLVGVVLADLLNDYTKN
ncbi:MAG: stage II sporulation protein P [Clostridiales bacterium]|nr:stage II sporulation protein P [Clostridiales bacterium]